jgi:hypothetical protein
VPAKKRGISTIQYTGHIDMGPCEYSDYCAKDWFKAKDILEGLLYVEGVMTDVKYVVMKWKDGWQEVVGVERTPSISTSTTSLSA